MANESTEQWICDAKDLARADKELKIERWVRISIEIRNPDGTRELLHAYDLPESMRDRWEWLFRWRKAKTVCLYPRSNVGMYACRYDKRTGLQTGANTLLGKVAAAKAQITKVERSIEQYIAHEKQNNLFFDINTDERLKQINAKLERKKDNYEKALEVLKSEVIKFKNNPNMYKLFIGFKNIGEFQTIMEAKKFAQRSGLSGMFNLMGDRYRDSWYISEVEAEQNLKKYEDEKAIN